ncbi:hypothetical protein TrLO_g1358 [Triparma laevis f. longispina]|uniref:Uncharacterized protein n=1 Tax=Triparma laevis f. longispina TaxID=1714387 RepID=A0A9W7FMS9_9STRA|nr:hypothetical protein TrLO_g1358 [Triparma laevis f. longispina]
MNIAYACRSPWEWVFKKALEDSYDGVEVYQSLRLLKSAFDIDGGIRRRGGPSTFSFIIHDDDGKAIYAGDSDVFESLEDKDEFVTCVNEAVATQFIAHSTLIDFDFHCHETKAASFELPSVPAVLKTPLGSCGDGVYFVWNVSEVIEKIKDNYERAIGEKDFIESIQKTKGRIPRWVIQKEVKSRSLDGCKFHLRTYVLAVEGREGLDIFVYVREHEVRVASEKMEKGEGRERGAHITNGASGGGTRRLLLRNVEELRSLKGELEGFVVSFFEKMQKGSNLMARKLVGDGGVHFVLAGVDIMVDVDGTMTVLEVNAYPAAPSEADLGESNEGKEFGHHLVGLGWSLCDFLKKQSWKGNETDWRKI